MFVPCSPPNRRGGSTLRTIFQLSDPPPLFVPSSLQRPRHISRFELLPFLARRTGASLPRIAHTQDLLGLGMVASRNGRTPGGRVLAFLHGWRPLLFHSSPPLRSDWATRNREVSRSICLSISASGCSRSYSGFRNSEKSVTDKPTYRELGSSRSEALYCLLSDFVDKPLTKQRGCGSTGQKDSSPDTSRRLYAQAIHNRDLNM